MKNLTKWMLLLALTLAPLSGAHEGGVGAPKTHCETPFTDTAHHEYGAPATGEVIFLGLDASVPPCPYGDTTWDGHIEFAFGGAWLQAATSACVDVYADHAPGTEISVYDAVLTPLGIDVLFSVYADTERDPNLPPEEPNCGDFQSDFGINCVNTCTPGFPPGLDGSYQVYVSGTTGHIYNGGGESERPPGVITIHGTGNTVRAIATPAGWDCGGWMAANVVEIEITGTFAVTCTPPNGHPDCASTSVHATMVADPDTTLDANSRCGADPHAHVHLVGTDEDSHSDDGSGNFPWTCDVTINGDPADWWVHCDVNVP